MALALGCADKDVPWLRDRLRASYGVLAEPMRLDPLNQFVKSFISSLTPDEISEPAYGRLVGSYSNWSALAVADWHDLTRIIEDVSHLDVKARQMGLALAAIEAEHPDFKLGFLGEWPVERALSWLERLPGCGREISASTLNFSNLCRAAFVVDQHVLRIMRRFGLVGPKGSNVHVYDAVMEVTAKWTAFDLFEFHALLKHLGQTICRPTPRCHECPLGEGCARKGVPDTKKTALPPPSSSDCPADHIDLL